VSSGKWRARRAWANCTIPYPNKKLNMGSARPSTITVMTKRSTASAAFVGSG